MVVESDSRLAALLALVLSAAAPAHAATALEEAAAQFEHGRTASQRGEYTEAAKAFEAAYRLAPRAPALFNAGLAWEAAGETPRAADAYEGAIASGELAPALLEDARSRLGRLERALGLLKIEGPAGCVASVERMTGVQLPRTLHLRPGVWSVYTSCPGQSERVDRVELAAAMQTRLAIAAMPALAAPSRDSQAETSARMAASNGRGWAIAGWTAMGLAVATGGAAAWMGLSALDARDAFTASGLTDAAAHDRADSLRTWANVGWGTAAALGLSGALMLTLTDDRPAAGPGLAVGAAAGPGGAMALLRVVH